VSPWSFFFPPLFIIIFKEREERERNKERKNKKTQEMHQSFDYDTIGTIKKSRWDKSNAPSDYSSGTHLPPNAREPLTFSGREGNTLGSLLMIFIGVVGFFSLRSFL
jgi:hypothetical protein